eukprot:4997839-Pyramimonas_sp.AAC.1
MPNGPTDWQRPRDGVMEKGGALYQSKGDSPRPGQQCGINNPRPNSLYGREEENQPLDNPKRKLEITRAWTKGERQPC